MKANDAKLDDTCVCAWKRNQKFHKFIFGGNRSSVFVIISSKLYRRVFSPFRRWNDIISNIKRKTRETVALALVKHESHQSVGGRLKKKKLFFLRFISVELVCEFFSLMVAINSATYNHTMNDCTIFTMRRRLTKCGCKRRWRWNSRTKKNRVLVYDSSPSECYWVTKENRWCNVVMSRSL